MVGLALPGGLNAAAFLTQHWQKKPLLMRGAVDPQQFSLSADEVAGLALEPDVEARLLVPDAHGQMMVSEPPFASEDFTGLPPRDWTLLVNDVEKHLPELAGFLDDFDFIPSWRFDDLMISVAAPGGGVGPHVDQYDVFLCQMQGHRRWKIGEAGNHKESSVAGLRQIAPFVVSEEYLLGLGDVLYLPPGIPHDGVAEDLCCTWSVGFRAPTAAELATGLEIGVNNIEGAARYCDPDLAVIESRPGLIGQRALERFRSLVGKRSGNDETFRIKLGEFLTTPKPWLTALPPPKHIAAGELSRRLTSGEPLRRHGMAIFAHMQCVGEHCFFASGRTYRVAGLEIQLAQLLCAKREFTGGDFGPLSPDGPEIQLLASLYNQGQMLFENDWENDGDQLPG
ncbi:MAG: cupin domain-containing protein [Gammaproteobacteria bacterium]|nr:cupin domain-containing protein [Gammaproteobacteria bacterium]